MLKIILQSLPDANPPVYKLMKNIDIQALDVQRLQHKWVSFTLPKGRCWLVLIRPSTLLQPAAAHKRDYEGTRDAASSGLSRVGRVGGVVGMLGV